MCPEVCEVSHIVDQLWEMCMKEKHLLQFVDIVGGRYKRHGVPDDWDIFVSNLPLQWVDVQSKGKFLYFVFKNRWGDRFYLWNTLAMTGGWTKKRQKHSHIIFYFLNNMRLYFNDPRCFGTVSVSFGDEMINNKLAMIGNSWLGPFRGKSRSIGVSFDEFREKVNGSVNVCCFLMDQSVFSGIGNYLLSEILYDSQVSPYSLMGDIPLDKLYDSICNIVMLSYGMDGVSFRDYCGVDGEIGEYQNYLKVYHQKEDPTGRKIISEIGPHRRMIHWVPELQN